LATAAVSVSYGHQSGPLGEAVLDWRTAQIERAVASWMPAPIVTTINGKRCITADVIHFDVLDELAFDLDEDIALRVDVVVEGEDPSLAVSYKRNGLGQITDTVAVPGGSERRSHTVDMLLHRARFANNNPVASDFSLRLQSSGSVTAICGVSFERSFQTPQTKFHGDLVMYVKDEHDLTTPALVGIYDERDRMPLPNVQAIPFRKFTTRRDKSTSAIRFGGNRLWPVANRSAFYINGRYEARLPAGEYTLVVAKGPEYRVTTRAVTIDAEDTTTVEVKLARWTDMRAEGWYSGDAHIHYKRENESDDKNLLLVTQAEDLQVANTLQMGNVGEAYYPQHRWAPVTPSNDSAFALVPGQEDPRTGHLGHTLHLNLKQPVRIPERYLLYHEVFERTRAQGGTVGYSHVRDDDALDSFDVGARKGMALDVPFALVDFVEVLEFGHVSTRTWFDYLKNHGNTAAVSAPIYVYVNGQSFWKPVAVPEIVARIKADLAEVMIFKPFEYEAWDASETRNRQLWEATREALRNRVRKVTAIYDELAARATQLTQAESSP
jgi:hypothetical protein